MKNLLTTLWHTLTACRAETHLGSCVSSWRGTSLPTLLLAVVASLSAQAQTYDLLLKGGHVIDPANEIDQVIDIAITSNRIAKVASDIPAEQAKKTVDVSGLHVVPGLIDLHGHTYGPGVSLFPDDTAISSSGWPGLWAVAKRVGPLQGAVSLRRTGNHIIYRRCHRNFRNSGRRRAWGADGIHPNSKCDTFFGFAQNADCPGRI